MIELKNETALRERAEERVCVEFERYMRERAERHERDLKRAGKEQAETVRRKIAEEKKLIREKRRSLVLTEKGERFDLRGLEEGKEERRFMGLLKINTPESVITKQREGVKKRFNGERVNIEARFDQKIVRCQKERNKARGAYREWRARKERMFEKAQDVRRDDHKRNLESKIDKAEQELARERLVVLEVVAEREGELSGEQREERDRLENRLSVDKDEKRGLRQEFRDNGQERGLARQQRGYSY